MRKKVFPAIILFIFTVLLSSCSAWYDSKSGAIYLSYDDAVSYTAGSFSYGKDDLTVVNVEWCKGDITVKNSSSDTLYVYESGDGLSKSEKLRYKIDNGALEIRYWQSGYWGRIDYGEKNLTVELPYGAAIRIVSDYGAVYSDGLNVSSVDISAKNGDVSLGSVNCSLCSISSESGNIALGKVSSERSVTIRCTAGDVTAESVTAVEKATVICSSGGIFVPEVKADVVYAESFTSSPKIERAECNTFTLCGAEEASVESLTCEQAKIFAGGTVTVSNLCCEKLNVEAAGDITLYMDESGAAFCASKKQKVMIYGFSSYNYLDGEYTVGSGMAEIKFAFTDEGVLSLYKIGG